MEFYGSGHNHTDDSNFRLRDSTNSLKELCWYAADELKHDFIAITDHETIASAIDCQKIEKQIREKYPNFKVIRGNEIYLCRNGLNKENFIRGEDKYFHFILLAKDAIGHEQLRELSTRAWLQSFETNRMTRVPTYYSDLAEVVGKNPGHVIFSTACLGSKPAQLILKWYKEQDAAQYEYIKQWLINISKICGPENFFLETQPSFNKEQIIVNQTYKKLSEEIGFPVIITLDAHYLKKEDEPIHHAFLTAQDGERETSEFYASTYMMSREEIHSYMDKSIGEETVSQWMNNTKKIYDMCEDYDLTHPLHIPYLPRTIDTINQNEFGQFKDKIKELEYFYKSPHKADNDMAAAIVRKILKEPETYNNEKVFKMIDECLEAVRLASEKQQTQWSAYLLNMRDYINVIWEKGNSLVGCSRGSGGGFILLNILGITQLNPAKEKAPLRYWRFLNPERVSPLDIDTDIEGGKRPQVYKALQDEYGIDRVSKVLTIRTEKSKSAILTACFVPNTLINTLKGLKHIQDIDETDIVLTTNGKEKVITPTYRDYNGKIYTIKNNGIGLPLEVTENHQFLVLPVRKKKSKKRCDLYDPCNNLIKSFSSIKDACRYYENHIEGGKSSVLERYKKHNGYYLNVQGGENINGIIQWLPASAIEKTDYLLSPVFNEEKDIDEIYFDKEEQNPYSKGVVYIPEKIKIDSALSELLGIYMAEGNVAHNYHGVIFTIHQEENVFCKKIISLLEKVFNITKEHISLRKKKDSKGLSIEVHSTPLGRWFNKYCSGNSETKKVPSFILNSSKENQLAFLKGFFLGDGYGRQRENSAYEAKITSVSYSLVEGLWLIAARNNYNCSCLVENRENRKIAYNLTFYGENAKQLFNYKYNNIDFSSFLAKEKPIKFNDINYYPIKIKDIKISEYKGKVYCLETPSHNYIINNIVSHNCRGLGVSPEEASYLSSFIKADRGIVRTLKQTFYGDEENDIPADTKFQELMTEKYPKVWQVAQKIEGLCCGVGSHAGGVIFYDEPITKTTALMRTANDDIITQFDLHRAEETGLIKIDLLSIEALDRMRACLDLLVKYNYINSKGKTLRQIYEDTIGIYKIERNEPKMWQLLHNHKIESLFQMEQQSGIKGIELTKPQSVEELASINSVMRLMTTEKGAKQPLEIFADRKKNPQLWEQEMIQYGLTEEERQWLHRWLDTSYGICETQEMLMSMLQDEKIGGHSLLFSDKVRKSIAKKKPEEFLKCQGEFYQTIVEKNLSKKLAYYVWQVIFGMSRGYSFNFSGRIKTI